MTKSRLTQRDVARHAGVSQAVVSYVLNGTNSSRTSEETRQRVLQAMEELGYVPHGVARGMRTGRSMLIGSVVPDITNPFYPAFQRGVQDTAEAAGFSLVTFNTDGQHHRELACIRTALQIGVDGLIVSLFQTAPDELDIIHTRNIPLVVYGTLEQQPINPSYDVIDIDVTRATAEVVDLLAGRGHKAIGLIDGPADITRIRPRRAAFYDALRSNHLDVNASPVVEADFTEESGYSAMDSLLSATPRPSAVIAANDIVAMGALIRIHEQGLKVPEDIALVGYDDIPAARLLNPALTTIALQPERIGSRAVQFLLDRINGSVTGTGRSEFLPYELVLRKST